MTPLLLFVVALAVILPAQGAQGAPPPASCNDPANPDFWRANTEGTTNSGAGIWAGIKSLVHVGTYADRGEDCLRVSSISVGRTGTDYLVEFGWFMGYASWCNSGVGYQDSPTVFYLRKDLTHGRKCFLGSPLTHLNQGGNYTMRAQDANGDDAWDFFLFQNPQQFGNTLWDYSQGTLATNGERHYCCSSYAHFDSLQKMQPLSGGTWVDFNGTSCFFANDTDHSPVYKFDWVSPNESKVDQSGVNCTL